MALDRWKIRLGAALLGMTAGVVVDAAEAQPCPTREQLARGFQLTMSDDVVYDIFPSDGKDKDTVIFREYVPKANGPQQTMINSYRGLINYSQTRGSRTAEYKFQNQPISEDHIAGPVSKEVKQSFVFWENNKPILGSFVMRFRGTGVYPIGDCPHPTSEFEKITTLEDDNKNTFQTIRQRIIYSKLLRFPVLVETTVEGAANVSEVKHQVKELSFKNPQ